MFGNESGFKENKGLLEDQKIKTVLQFTIAIHSIQTLIHSSSVFRLLSVWKLSVISLGWKMGKIADFFFSFTNNFYWFNSLKLLKQFLPYFVIVNRQVKQIKSTTRTLHWREVVSNNLLTSEICNKKNQCKV